MELRHLRYFVAVADELNFRKAAELLSISRPALSKQIKDLETEIGVRLLERDTVSVSLTKAGEVFQHDARALLAHARKSVERAKDAELGKEGRLRIGSVGIIATDFLPATLQVFHKRYPGVEVGFVEMQPQEQLDALDGGAIDVGFAYGSDPVTDADKDLLCVISSQFGLGVSRHHRWAGRESIDLSEIAGETMLCFGKGPRSHREEIQQFFQSEKKAPPPRFRTIEGFDSLITLVAADQGVSMLPEVLDLTSQGIVILPVVSKTAFEFRMWAVWRRDSPSLVVKHFVELLRQRI